jgi:hypothetical protein
MEEPIPSSIVEQVRFERCRDCGRMTSCYPVSQKTDGTTLWRCDVCMVYTSRSEPA